MADAPEILKNEKLRDSYPKLNAAIRNSNEALSTANTAKTNADNAVATANEANAKSDDTQQQLNNIVINNGQSDAEVLQARGTFAVLNDRMNATDSQLADVIHMSQFLRIVPEDNDSGRLQRAINEAVSNKKLLKLEPHKTYSISTTLEATGDLILIGDNSTIKLISNTEFIIKVFQNTLYRFFISGITFDGNNLNTGNGLLYILGSKKFLFTNNEVVNSTTNGIWLFNNNQNIIIENNLIDNIKYSGILVEGETVGEFNTGQIEEINCVIKNNLISNCIQQNGIFIAHALKKGVIEGNIIKNVGDEGIEIGGVAGSYGTEEVTISNNIIENASTYFPNTNGAGIIVRRSKYVTVTSNAIKGSLYHGLQILDSSHVSVSDLVIVDSGNTSITIANSTNVRVQAKVINSSSVSVMNVFSSKQIDLKIEDDSPVSQKIIHDHSFDQSELTLNKLKYQSKIAPTFGTKKWGLYYQVVSRDGFFDSNLFEGNALSNSLFLQNSLAGWTSETGITSTVLNGEVTLNSTTDFRYFKMLLREFAKRFDNQFILEFEYKTSNTDSIVYVESTDSTNKYQNLGYSLPASPTDFTVARKLLYISPIYPNVDIKFCPRSAGGTGNLIIRKLKLIMPVANEKIGFLDKQLMN